MNRELKFRGWHPQLKRMFSAEEMGQDQLTLLTDGRGFINVSGADIRLSQLVPMIPMQYTGLLDKNGKEIYEGDILKYVLPGLESDDPSTEYIEPVVFKDGCFNVEGHTPVYVTTDWDCEVLGNIYEHPNLLEP